MLVVVNRRHADHVPPGEVDNGVVVPPHEVPSRIDVILAALKDRPDFLFEDAAAASEETVAALHEPAYVAYLREASASLRIRKGQEPRAIFPSVFPFGAVPRARGGRALQGVYCFDTFTPILAGTFSAAMGGAGAALRAAEAIVSGEERQAFVLTRPPGHHAERDRCGGYSYLNNAALAADHLSRAGKIAILDLDAHHGNGTQHIFYARSDVLTVSIHGDPSGLFPYFSGFTDETGSGPGIGFNHNLPLPPGTGEKDYRQALAAALEIVGRFQPGFLVVSFGADTHEADPIGGFKLKTEAFERMGKAVRGLDLPTVLVQEGGYNLDCLGGCVAGFLGGILME